MSSGSITSTTNTFGMIPGTLTGSVGVPGPQGPAGPTGATGATGPAGPGVPVGGTAGQFLTKTTTGVDYATGWTTLSLAGYATESWVTAGFYPLTGNPSGFITSSALLPYLLSSTAASTYQTIAGMSSYLTTSAAASTYAPLASPVFTGNPTAPTPTFGDNDTSIATTAFVQSALLGGTAVARNLEVEVRNQSGSTIAAGSIVYISGATGNKPLITLAQANNDANSAQTIGFVKTSIANNGTGYVIVRGELENIDTSALTEGVQLYLSPTTAGTWTTTKPSAPQHLVYVGIVIRSHPTLGTILVAVQNGYELNELHDVAISSPTNGQVLKYDSTTSLWKNQTDAVGAVTSVAGRTGAVTLSNADISGLGTMATATATDYLSKAGNLSGLANTGTARTNLGLGTIATFNDAPSDGSQYARKNGAWDVVSGGGASLPAVQIAASAIDPRLIALDPSAVCIPLTYPSHTDVLNGLYLTSLIYESDATATPSLNFTGLTALTAATVGDIDSMTSAPNFSGLTALVTATVQGNDSMTSGPNFSDCTALTTANVSYNPVMGSVPNFSGCTSLIDVDVNSCNLGSTQLLNMCAQLYAVAPAGGSLIMDGESNASFDGQSLPTQITDLQSNGWSVTFNDNNPP